MSKIEIPFMPIEDFNESEVCEAINKSIQEETEAVGNSENVNINFPKVADAHKDILLILYGIGMEKYFDIFQKLEIPLEAFLQLKDHDLEAIGIHNPKDRQKIILSLKVHSLSDKEEFVIPENHLEDFRIAKNAFNELLLLQNYAAYVDLHMKKHKFTDYRINWKESACMYLKEFLKTAVTQSEILSRSLYDEGHSDHLIGKIMKVHNLSFPKNFQEKLESTKFKSKKLGFLKVMVVVGFCSIIFLTAKALVRAK